MKKTAIVFVHGHMGCSKQFEPLIKALGERLDVDMHNIVLPGHETDVKGFAAKNRSDWQSAVDDALDKLRADYDDLILVGHSMGGLLLINSAIARADKIRAITAISLPLHIKITPHGIRIRLGAMRKSTKDRHTQAAKEMCGVSGVSFFNSYKLIPNTLALLKLMKITRGALPSLSVPLIVINSQKDEIVSMKTLGRVKKLCPAAKTITLRDASHFWFPDEETEIIAGCIEAACPEHGRADQ